MTSPEADVHVDIIADFTKFDRDLRKGLAKAEHDADRSAENIGHDLEKTVKHLVSSVNAEFATVANEAEDVFREVAHDADKAGVDINHSITRGVHHAGNALTDLRITARGVFSSVAGDVAKLGRTAEVGIGQDLTGSLGAAAKGTAELGLSMGALKVALIVAVTPAVIGLSAALVDLIGFIGVAPAAVAGLVATFAPLVVAFQGFGEAISAITEGDPEKINEALKKLSPSARSVAKEFAKLLPQFRELKKQTQEAFFGPLRGELTALADTFLPEVSAGFQQVGKAFALTFKGIGDALIKSGADKVLADLFGTIAKNFATLTPGVSALFVTFFKLVEAGLPFLQRFAKFLNDAFLAFASFVDKKIADGGFNKFVEDAIDTTKDLIDLVKSLGRVLGTIFGATDDSGRGLIKSLTDAIDKVNEFLKTPEGQKALDDLKNLIIDTGKAILFLADAFTTIGKFAVDFKQGIEGAFRAIGDAASAVGSGVKDAALAVKDFAVKVGHGFMDALDAVGGFFSDVGDFFAELPGKIADFLKSLPGLLAGLFQAAFDEAIRSVGRGIGLILFAVLGLPGLIIDAVGSLATLLGQFFIDVWDAAKQNTIDRVRLIVGFLLTLPGLIGSALAALPGLLAGIFTTAFDFVKGAVQSGISAVIDFVKGVPGRLVALRDFFVNAGLSLIHGFLDGFRKAGNFLTDVAGDIVAGIKSGLNHVIGKINEGIAQVDDVLPGSLPRIPMLAKGGVAFGPSIIAEAGKPEVALPLDDPRSQDAIRRAIGDTGGQTINFGPGSVQVVFSGVVPTEKQAQETGMAVGQGIAGVLQRRNIRTQVAIA